MLVAGDIGGTKTDLAIFSSEAGPLSPLAKARVHSADYPSLQAIVKEFLAKVKKPVDRACFAVAGPVLGGRVKTTNLPWDIADNSLAQELNIKSVQLINDLEAIARAVPILRPSDVQTINAGEPVPEELSPLSLRARAWGNPSSPGMVSGTWPTAPRVAIAISPLLTRGRFACLNTCSSSSTTLALSTSVQG